MDSENRRFIAEDPIRSGYNWYAYVDNNPTNWVDPLGLYEVTIGGTKLTTVKTIKENAYADIREVLGAYGLSYTENASSQHLKIVSNNQDSNILTVESSTKGNNGKIETFDGSYYLNNNLDGVHIDVNYFAAILCAFGYKNKMNVSAGIISENRDLSLEEMQINASYICSYFRNLGWTDKAIAAMLGNMQAESTINPGRWQIGFEGNINGGFGLTQWTPPHNLPYFDWAKDNGLDPYGIDTQLYRLQLESEGKIYQWQSNSSLNMSFNDFTQSTLSVEELAIVFLQNYERPKNPTQEEQNKRKENANYWYNYLY